MQQFSENLLSGIGVTDLIDIAIVAWLVYKSLGFIRDSRAEKLIKGVIILVIVALLSGLLHLYTLEWILKSTLSVGILALIILFQPELRRALERMGRNRLFRSSSPLNNKTANNITTAFVEAIENMASERVGALIVFERKMPLNDIIATGTIVDARPSAQLIENIFYKGSPLHDGALVVRDGKLYAAGCVLPLTENMDLPKSLGTRHRAGIGMTEQTDSVVVIVSEETGIISLVQGARLERYLDGRTLEKMLLSMFLGEQSEDKGSKAKELLKKIKGGRHV